MAHSLRNAETLALVLLACLGIACGMCSANELEEILANQDAYTFVFCYYEDAVAFAIKNLDAEDPEPKRFAEDIASKIVSARLYGQLPTQELKLLSLYSRSATDDHKQSKIAFAQLDLGSEEGIPTIISVLKDRRLSFDLRGRAIRNIPESKASEFEEAFVAALQDKFEVRVEAAKRLHRLGNPKGKEWLLAQLKQYPVLKPKTVVLEAVAELRIKEAVAYLLPLLSYRGSDYSEAENRAVRTEVAMAL
ncbi:MAG: hypothetical protein QGH74_05480 [Candidatus Brocadiia bacterium]|jgi:hypothetical protein|nr:hypothetical protein [Candidatus Brocadiia bacterium]